MNLEAFLMDVLAPILDHPESLRIEVSGEGKKREVLIHAEPADRGRIIGKSGRMISSLRTLCKAAGEKAGLVVELELFEEDDGPRPAPRCDRALPDHNVGGSGGDIASEASRPSPPVQVRPREA